MVEDFSLSTSDADIVIHLAKASQLGLLKILFAEVYIPKFIVEHEIKKRAGKGAWSIIKQEIDKGTWLFVDDPDKLPPAQKLIYRENLKEAKAVLDDPGEAEGIALAEAKGIPFFASNDTKDYGPHDIIYKKRYLEVHVRPLTHQDILFLAFVTGKLDKDQCQQIHDLIRNSNDLNKMTELIRHVFAKSAQKFAQEKWFVSFLKFHHVSENAIAKFTK